MKQILYIFIALITLNSCSEYQQALKSEDVATKFKLGEQLFNEGKFSKASRLFEQIVPAYRGKPQAEKLMYMYTKAFYNTKDYYTAGYQAERYTSAYPKSEKAEEIAFLGAKSYYQLAPVYTKDQGKTQTALEKIQAFINRYPSSSHVAEANTLVQDLDGRLEKKSYHIAKQYNTLSDFQSSIKAFDNFLSEFPGTKLREDALFYKLDSAYKLAVNSVEYKKKNRLETAKSYYDTFKRLYADSKYMSEADKMLQTLNKELEQYKS